MTYYISTGGTNLSTGTISLSGGTIRGNIGTTNPLSSITFPGNQNNFYLGSSTSINLNPNNLSSQTIDLYGDQGHTIVQGAAATIRLPETNASGAAVETGLAKFSGITPSALTVGSTKVALVDFGNNNSENLFISATTVSFTGTDNQTFQLSSRINYIQNLKDDLLKSNGIPNREEAILLHSNERTRIINILREERDTELADLQSLRETILQKIAEKAQNSVDNNELLALVSSEISNSTFADSNSNEDSHVNINGETDTTGELDIH